MKVRIIYLLLCFCVALLAFDAHAQIMSVSKADSGKIQIDDSSKIKLNELVGKRLLSQVRLLHKRYDMKAFSRAYSMDKYIYGVYKKPSWRQRAYECVLQKIKGGVVIEHYKFLADTKKGTLIVWDEKSKKYIPVDDWLLIYKDKIINDQKN